jgi:hypothetical protein
MAKSWMCWRGYDMVESVKTDEIINLIRNALDLVSQEYYEVLTAYKPEGIIRERAFCYELYHHMRSLQEHRKMNRFYVHGEIDKRGYSLLSEDERRNPDFIFHVPGELKNNFIVCEVKGKLDTKDDVYKDIQTLIRFTTGVLEYKMGVHIVFNYSIADYKEKMSEYLKDKEEDNYDMIGKIHVICKKSSKVPWEQDSLVNLLK